MTFKFSAVFKILLEWRENLMFEQFFRFLRDFYCLVAS